MLLCVVVCCLVLCGGVLWCGVVWCGVVVLLCGCAVVLCVLLCVVCRVSVGGGKEGRAAGEAFGERAGRVLVGRRSLKSFFFLKKLSNQT